MAKLYYPTPDEIQYAKPLNEIDWFSLYQQGLVNLANTDEGRDLLCIDKRPYPVVAIRKNMVRYYLGQEHGQDYWLADFRIGAKWGNVIRFRWPYVAQALSRIAFQQLMTWPMLGGVPRRAAARFAITTFFPDPNPETTSVDGRVVADKTGTPEIWTSIRSTTTNLFANDSASITQAGQINSASIFGEWQFFSRGIFLFDTSSLPNGDTIDSALFRVFGSSKIDDFSDSLAMVTSTPASNTALVGADYSQVQTVLQAPVITLVAWSNIAYNDYTLNATGLGNIDQAGVTKFATRCESDRANAEPAWTATDFTNVAVQVVASSPTAADDPRLEVTHTGAARAGQLIGGGVLSRGRLG